MNIVIKKIDSQEIYYRPDTTLTKESKDFFAPDGCDVSNISLGVAFKIDKPGKYIGRDYINRYISTAYLTLLIHPIFNSIDESNINYKIAINSVDNTTYLGSKLFEIGNHPSKLTISVDYCQESNFRDYIYKQIVFDIDPIIDEATECLINLSKHTSFRIGDLLIIQLPTTLSLSSNNTVVIKGDLPQPLFCFDIK